MTVAFGKIKGILVVVLSMLIASGVEAQQRSIKVMAWNIFHGANDIEKGVDHAITVISALNPDVVLMVETYGSGKKIADALGFHFHLIAPEGTPLNDKSVNLSIISRYPFGERIDTPYPFYLGGREIVIDGQRVRFFSNWFHYLPWHDQPETMGKSVDELLEWEKSETKYAMFEKVLPILKKYASEADSIPMVFGGDMNAPSHLDWSENTKHLHNGLVVPWYVSSTLEQIGLIDTYRAIHPNPLTHKGITWHTKGEEDAHRIDYIYSKGKHLKPMESATYKAFFNEPFEVNGRQVTYPSDHGIVVTTFELDI